MGTPERPPLLDDDALPERLGPFRVHRRLGAGGMGTVFEAADDAGGRVALKALTTLGPLDLHGFKHEFRRMAGVDHPNLVRLYELLQADETWLLSMELVEGRSLLAHLRDGAGVEAVPADELLRAALGQLASALETLHGQGLLHLDLKPENVLVERSGRVVVLDFGLVRRVGETPTELEPSGGTPLYMAPEQFRGAEAGPAADWYAVGVLLFEALTGATPFGERPWDVLLRPAPRASSVRPGIAPDLDALCAGLLSRDPEERLDAARRLRPNDAPGEREHGVRSALLGRRDQRTALDRAFADVLAGQTVFAHVFGPSGMGKSALVEDFLAELRAGGRATVLTGKCHEWESIPYKGFDPAIDELCTLRARLPEHERRLPAAAGPASALFPLLRMFAGDVDERVDATPHEQRARAIGAFKELLRDLGRERPVVVFLDDVQWADHDGARLAVELLSVGAPLRLLLVVASRTGEGGAFLEELQRARAQVVLTEERRIEVGPLSGDEGMALAEALLSDGDRERARTIAREAGGSPFFIEELVRLASSRATDGHATVDDVVQARVEALSGDARRLLEVVAVAGHLPEQGIAFDVAVTEGDRYQLLASLRSARLLRTGGARGTDPVEPEHDRIRECVMKALAPDARRVVHRGLAEVLERRDEREPEVLCHHWEGAGDLARARPWALRAADEAVALLAFERAASWFRLALSWGGDGAGDRRELQEKLAESLFNAGRASDAAPVFAEAAAATEGAAALHLRKRAAESWLHGGHVDRGIDELRPLLAQVGLQYPTATQAVVSIVGQLLRHVTFGLGRKRAAVPSSDEAFVMDLCWNAGKVLTNVYPMQGMALHLRALRLALECGDARREGRSLVFVGTLLESMGGPLRKAGARMLARAEALATETNDPYLRGFLLIFRGVGEFSGEGRWHLAREWAEEGVALLNAKCTGVAWEVDMGLAVSLKATMDVEGSAPAFAADAVRWMRDAGDRGDIYARRQASHLVCLQRIALDDLPGARAQIRADREGWATQYTVQHFHKMRQEVACDLYECRPAEALRRFLDELPRMRQIGLHRLALSRIEMLTAEAIPRLGVVLAGSSEAPAHLRRVGEIAAQLERETRSDARPVALALRAALAAHRGLPERAAELLLECESVSLSAHLDVMGWCARRRRGELQGTPSVVAEVDAWLGERGVVAPERWVDLFIPQLRGVHAA